MSMFALSNSHPGISDMPVNLRGFDNVPLRKSAIGHLMLLNGIHHRRGVPAPDGLEAGSNIRLLILIGRGSLRIIMGTNQIELMLSLLIEVGMIPKDKTKTNAGLTWLGKDASKSLLVRTSAVDMLKDNALSIIVKFSEDFEFVRTEFAL
jgi:hypothetical protein